MSNIRLAYKCGHLQSVDFSGSFEAARATLEYSAKNSVCDSCKGKSQGSKKEYKEEEMPMLDKLSWHGSDSRSSMLPVIKGTPGMVQWAEAIREDALKQRANMVPPMLNEKQMEGFDEEKKRRIVDLHRRMVAAREELESNTSAEWWIEHKDDAYCYVHNTRYRNNGGYNGR